jgi:hypothetical protein
MKASYQKTGFNFLPVIKHENRKPEVLYGAPLASKKTATKYAQIVINQRASRVRASF